MKKTILISFVVFVGIGVYFAVNFYNTFKNEISVKDTHEVITITGNTYSSVVTLDDAKVRLSGRFLALIEGTDRLDKIYQYLLLDTGTEIFRIDLRPLVGYSDIDIVEKLGVDRGQTITIIGVMNDEGFRLESIE